MINAALRPSKAITRVTNGLAALREGPSTRALPPSIKSLRVRYAGLKGNAGARHWARESLPGLRFANPAVEIIIEAPPAPLPSTPSTSSPDADAAPVTPPTEPWKQAPGIFISFNSSLPTAFFPLPPARSEKLVKRFWTLVESPEALENLAAGKAIVEGVEEVEVAEPEVVVGEGIVEEVKDVGEVRS